MSLTMPAGLRDRLVEGAALEGRSVSDYASRVLDRALVGRRLNDEELSDRLSSLEPPVL